MSRIKNAYWDEIEAMAYWDEIEADARDVGTSDLKEYHEAVVARSGANSGKRTTKG